VEQQKKMDLDWKSGRATASGTRSFLQLVDIAPNVGAKSGRREEEEGINEPRGHGRALYRRWRGRWLMTHKYRGSQ
jgi:hypothetical protein